MHILVHGQQLLKLTKGVRSVRTQLTMISLEHVRRRIFITSLFLHNRSHGYPQFGHGKEYPMNVSNIAHEKVINRPQQANSIPGCGALCHYND